MLRPLTGRPGRRRMGWPTVVAVLAAVVGAVVVGHPSPAHASSGPDNIVVVERNSARFSILGGVGPSGVQPSFYFGNPGDVPLYGDWNCDGVQTPGMYRRSDGHVYLRNSNTQGVADIRFFFGNPGDIALAGDFNGNGCDTVSIYRPSEGRVFIMNRLGTNGGGLGSADVSYLFGNPGDQPFVGDFNGDGRDTVGLHRVATGLVYFRNSHTQGPADHQFIFGNAGDRIIAGDWNGNGIDTVAAYRESTGHTFVKNSHSTGPADHTLFVGTGLHVLAAGVGGGGLPVWAQPSPPTFHVNVEVPPGASLQGLVDAHPPGTVFRLHGIHVGQSVTPKNGQVFVGAPGAVMRGNGISASAFGGRASDVTIVGLQITGYAPPSSGRGLRGAINGEGPRWVVWGNEIHHNATVGIRLKGDGSVIRGNDIHHNGQLGIRVSEARNAVVEGNVIAYNNWQARFDWGVEAGGTKFWRTTGLVVRGNWSHHNHGPGLWSDKDNIHILYEGNLVEDNFGPGIFHEIGYDAVIRDNTVRRNGFGHAVWLWGSGIMIASSSNVQIHGNLVEGNHNGIGITQQSRGSGAHGPHLARNVTVRHNTVVGSGRSGAIQDIGSKAIYSSNITFDHNTYIGAVGWAWDDRWIAWPAWRGYGHDASGSHRP
jgi:hypothetical protein